MFEVNPTKFTSYLPPQIQKNSFDQSVILTELMLGNVNLLLHFVEKNWVDGGFYQLTTTRAY